MRASPSPPRPRPCRSPTTRASGRPASSTSPIRATRRTPSAGRSPSSSTAVPARARPISISERSGRASSPFGPQGQMPAPAAKLVDNPDHWLDLTDLVFVDPVGTGYSRAVGDAGKRYWGVTEDLGLDRDLHRPLSHRGRPARLAEVSRRRELRRLPRRAPARGPGRRPQHHRRRRVPDLAGAGVQPDRRRQPRAPARRAAPALLRRRPARAVGQRRRAEALAEVERFALGPYLTALAASPRNEAAMQRDLRRGRPPHRRARGGDRAARRPPAARRVRQGGAAAGQAADQPLRRLGDRARSLSRLQPRARRCAVRRPARACWPTPCRPISPTRSGVRTDLPYRLSNGQVVRQWNWRSGLGGREGYAGAADSLREVLAKNKDFKIAIAHGMTDLVTPYLTSRYVIDHLPASLTGGSGDAQPSSRRPHDVPARRLSRRPARRRGEALSEGRVASWKTTPHPESV